MALTIALAAFPKAGPATGVQVANVTPADIGAALLVGVVALRLAGGRDDALLRAPLLAAPVLVLVAAAVTTLWSTDPMLSAVGAVRYAELFCLVPIATVCALKDRLDVALLFGALAALGLMEGSIGVYQSVTRTGAGFAEETVRAVGTYGAANALAMATVVACAQTVLLALALRGPGRRTRILSAVGAAALTAPLLLSLSRGALLASVAAAAVMSVSTGLRRTIATVVAAGAVAVLSVGLSGSGSQNAVAARFSSLTTDVVQPDRSVQDRYDLWSTALSIWQVAPVTGVGIKQFPAYRDSHAPLTLSSGSELLTPEGYSRGELLSPHNEYLLFLSEQGVVGLGSYAFLVLTLGGLLVSRLRSPPRGDVQDAMVLASVGLFTWFGVHLLYGDLSGPGAVLYSILLGMQLRAAITARHPLGPASTAPRSA